MVEVLISVGWEKENEDKELILENFE